MATRVIRRARSRLSDSGQERQHSNHDLSHRHQAHPSNLMSNSSMVDDIVVSPEDSLASLQASFNRQRLVLISVSLLLSCCLLVACIGIVLLYLRLRRSQRRDHVQTIQVATKAMLGFRPEDESPGLKDVIDIRPDDTLPTIAYRSVSDNHRPALTPETESTCSTLANSALISNKVTPLQTRALNNSVFVYGPHSPDNFPARRPLPHPDLKLTIATPSPKCSPVMTAVNSDSPDTALRPSARSLAPFTLSRLSVPVTAVPVSSYSSVTPSPARERSPYPLVVDFLDKLSMTHYKLAFSDQATLEALRNADATWLRENIPGISPEEADVLCRAVQEELTWIDRRVSESSLDDATFPVVLRL